MSALTLKPLTAEQRRFLENADQTPKPTNVNGTMEVRAVGDDTVELLIYGIIGSSWWGEETVTARDVVDQLRGLNPQTINVRINSHGGTCHDGVAIYNELRRHSDAGANVVCTVDGVAYSAASMIAMAGDEVVMPATALMMLHAPLGALYFEGNAQQLEEAAADLKNTLLSWGTALATTYARKSGKKRKVFEDMWATGKDYMYTAEEARKFGLCDRVDNLDEEDEEGISDEQAQALMQQLIASAPQHGMQIVAAVRPQLTAPLAQRRQPNTPAPASAIQPAMSGVITEESAMTEQEIKAKADAEAKAAATKGATEALVALRTRNSDIIALAEPHYGNKEVKAYVEKIFADADPTVTSENVGKHILSLLAQNSGPLNGNAGIVAGGDQRDLTRKAMGNAIEARVGMAKAEGDNPYRGHSMSELARECVAQAGVSTRGLDKREIVGLAFTHSTSDFPGLLGDTARKAVLKGYEEAEEQVEAFTRAVSVPDFKPTNLVGLGAFSDLLVVPEGSEFKYGTFSEQSQAMQIVTYGRLFSITRQAIINDDLGIFSEVPRKLGQAAKRTIAKAVFDLITSNPTLADGKTLFHADHGNLMTGAAISTTSVDGMRVAMGLQKDADGNTIRVPMKTLLTPLALGGLARTVRESQTEVSGSKNLTTPNTVRGTFDVVDDARLDANSPQIWYGVANPSFIDGIVIGYLDGNQTPYLEQEEGFTVDGVAWKVRLDAAPAIADYRGIYKNPGA